MEDTHGALKEAGAEDADLFGLNPYCNGRYSWSNRVKNVAESAQAY